MSGRQIVRVGRQIALQYPPLKRARTAYAMASRYGPTAYRAARKIGRAWKRSRRRGARRKRNMNLGARRVGEKPGTSSSKKNVQTDSLSTYSTRSLFQEHITNTQFGGSAARRQRGIINCRGFRICMIVRNDTEVPLNLNVAIITNKSEVDTVETQDFFRGTAGSRGQEFDNILTSLDFKCGNINTDKHLIIKHQRYEIKPNTETGPYLMRNGQNWKTIDWYVKVKRQLRYQDEAATKPENGACYLVWWADQAFTGSGAASVANAYAVQQRHIMYFRESKDT